MDPQKSSLIVKGTVGVISRGHVRFTMVDSLNLRRNKNDKDVSLFFKKKSPADIYSRAKERNCQTEHFSDAQLKVTVLNRACTLLHAGGGVLEIASSDIYSIKIFFFRDFRFMKKNILL